MNAPVKISDLIEAVEFDSPEHHSWLDRQTGRVVMVESYVMSALEEGDDERLSDAPDWQKEEIEIARAIVADTENRFIDAPDKFEFHEYRHMEKFIGSLSDDRAIDQLWRAIKGKGAFRHFKDTLIRLGIEKQWYSYRDQAMKAFVIEWAEANDLSYEDDSGERIPPKPQLPKP